MSGGPVSLDYVSAQDAADAARYWRDREWKKFAVDVVAGPERRLTYARTFYARARTPSRAIACVRRDGPRFPAGARFLARLAGPRELGCTFPGATP